MLVVNGCWDVEADGCRKKTLLSSSGLHDSFEILNHEDEDVGKWSWEYIYGSDAGDLPETYKSCMVSRYKISFFSNLFFKTGPFLMGGYDNYGRNTRKIYKYLSEKKKFSKADPNNLIKSRAGFGCRNQEGNVNRRYYSFGGKDSGGTNEVFNEDGNPVERFNFSTKDSPLYPTVINLDGTFVCIFNDGSVSELVNSTWIKLTDPLENLKMTRKSIVITENDIFGYQ